MRATKSVFVSTADASISRRRLARVAAVVSERAAAFGACEIASAAVVLAATHPGRISGLVVINGQARYLRADDYEIGVPEAAEQRIRQRIAQHWGTGTLSEILAPSAAGDESFVRMRARWERLGTGGPQGELAMWDAFVRHDIRSVLPAVRVPTLVLHRSDNPHFRIDHGRYLANHIEGARLVELPGRDHIFFVGDTGVMLDEIESFLTGVRGGIRADRVLATVLFTDIVGSTELATRRGDRAWHSLLDSHDQIVAEVIGYRGRLVRTTGDGVLATFDGPARAIRCACALREETRTLGLELRAGLHTGEVEVRGDDVGGIAVHIAARVAARAGPSAVWVSRTVTDLVVGSGLSFNDMGDHELKGLPGLWRLFAVDD
jgi:class 3 adenylate cyclase